MEFQNYRKLFSESFKSTSCILSNINCTLLLYQLKINGYFAWISKFFLKYRLTWKINMFMASSASLLGRLFIVNKSSDSPIACISTTSRLWFLPAHFGEWGKDHSWALSNMSLDYLGLLMREFFSIVNTIVPHDLQLVESSGVELWIQRANYVLHWDYLLHRGNPRVVQGSAA